MRRKPVPGKGVNFSESLYEKMTPLPEPIAVAHSAFSDIFRDDPDGRAKVFMLRKAGPSGRVILPSQKVDPPR